MGGELDQYEVTIDDLQKKAQKHEKEIQDFEKIIGDRDNYIQLLQQELNDDKWIEADEVKAVVKKYD